jgi:hypothetical protein
MVPFCWADSGLDVLCRVICEAHEGKILAMGERDQKIHSLSKERVKHIESTQK